MTAQAESGHATQSDALPIELATQTLIIAPAEPTRLPSFEATGCPASRRRRSRGGFAKPNTTDPQAHLPNRDATASRAQAHRIGCHPRPTLHSPDHLGRRQPRRNGRARRAYDARRCARTYLIMPCESRTLGPPDRGLPGVNRCAFPGHVSSERDGSVTDTFETMCP